MSDLQQSLHAPWFVTCGEDSYHVRDDLGRVVASVSESVPNAKQVAALISWAPTMYGQMVHTCKAESELAGKGVEYKAAEYEQLMDGIAMCVMGVEHFMERDDA